MSARSISPRPRVLIVDDSALMRALLKRMLAADGDIDVVGAACDAEEARALIPKLSPDVITLDVELPGMNGITFLERLMRSRPMPVIIVSSHTVSGASATIQALQAGALDVVAKPARRSDMEGFASALRDKVRGARHARLPGFRPAPSTPSAIRPTASAHGRRLIAIGASTGGVGAISSVLAQLPADMPPIVITQHMPPGYLERLAHRLAHQLSRDVAPAEEGEVLAPGMIRLAPSDRHLTVSGRAPHYRVRLSDGPPVSGHRPSVDVLFNSVAQSAGSDALGVLMTGMGRDGAAGLKAMRDAGAYCIGQSRDSCVVYGMPRAAAELGAVDEEIDLDEIAQKIVSVVTLPLISQAAK
ncbi:protein-glutamate methylesterase/protein-glutamine glutaminase [Oceanicella actignis]|uniref:Protein-glutamate methylesterase/protein-glutamine glutaminase n=1 Tax=Oceanicella actignis TaxID=1189325 RepID=A0A1M7T5C5_9RHOB|nr:chemotaxis response regulator protein-glutamate methylesterase [Oceanicella actignis]SET43160.1 two-component system, chemotaxis family, response regulator CheB [Oceanicella actignis]SHN65939.1 two-component system, chemotaxis family, response regulator CheB [Oceanicella actignis]